MTNFHPACCAPLREHWPLPFSMPAATLVSTLFQADQLQPGDFVACAVPSVPGAAKRQCEYLAGRLCARHALHCLTGQPAVPAVGEDRAPRWPSGVVGSITHSQGQAAALVAGTDHWCGVGIDLERLLSTERSQRLCGEILSPGELQRLEHLEPTRHAWLVTLTFSAKESLFKALFPLVGQRFYFQDAELLDWTDDGRLRMALLRDLGGEWGVGAELEGQFGMLGEQLLTLVAIARQTR